MPRVSVIIPAYNSAATIGDTIASVVAQTFTDWEIVVGDDASIDETAAVARAADPRVTVVSGTQNGGPAAGRNLAVGAAQGELLALLDADDRWLPDYLEQQVGLYDAQVAGRRRVGIVACDAYVEDAAGVRHGTHAERAGSLTEPITVDRLLEANPIFVSVVVPRRLVTELGGFSTETWGSEDHDLWLRILEQGYEVAANPKPLVIYREAVGSVSASRVGMARTLQATYQRALDRGNLTPRQRRAANRNLRMQSAVETLERRSQGERPGAAELTRAGAALVAYAVAHPRRWSAWVRGLAGGRGALAPRAGRMTAPLHVALNLVYLVPGETGGMEVYARELIPRLAARDDLRITCLVNREAADASDGPWGDVCPMEVVPVRATSRIEWVRGEQQHVPRMAARLGAGLVHSLASTAPLWGRVPRITTIHDLNYLLVPEAHFGLLGLGMRVLVPASVRRSRRLIVDAASTRDDLQKHLKVVAGKIDVVPLAAAPPVGVVATPDAELRARLGLGDRPVVLSPGARRPHKNLATVIDALAQIPAEQRPVLVATGYRTPYEDELRARAASLGVEGDLVLPEWLGAADLEGLYALSTAVVFVSRSEGFGLPVLEAMTRGVPVITSNRSSLPEVAGTAALLVDPDDPRAVAGALRAVLADPAERERLIAAGRARTAEFTWDRTAELTAASYDRALATSPKR